jgi:hypothetical protein
MSGKCRKVVAQFPVSLAASSPSCVHVSAYLGGPRCFIWRTWLRRLTCFPWAKNPLFSPLYVLSEMRWFISLESVL